MKYQVLLYLKNKSKKLKCCLLQFLFGTLRVKFFPFMLSREILKCLNEIKINNYNMYFFSF